MPVFQKLLARLRRRRQTAGAAVSERTPLIQHTDTAANGRPTTYGVTAPSLSEKLGRETELVHFAEAMPTPVNASAVEQMHIGTQPLSPTTPSSTTEAVGSTKNNVETPAPKRTASKKRVTFAETPVTHQLSSSNHTTISIEEVEALRNTPAMKYIAAQYAEGKTTLSPNVYEHFLLMHASRKSFQQKYFYEDLQTQSHAMFICRLVQYGLPFDTFTMYFEETSTKENPVEFFELLQSFTRSDHLRTLINIKDSKFTVESLITAAFLLGPTLNSKIHQAWLEMLVELHRSDPTTAQNTFARLYDRKDQPLDAEEKLGWCFHLLSEVAIRLIQLHSEQALNAAIDSINQNTELNDTKKSQYIAETQRRYVAIHATVSILPILSRTITEYQAKRAMTPVSEQIIVSQQYTDQVLNITESWTTENRTQIEKNRRSTMADISPTDWAMQLLSMQQMKTHLRSSLYNATHMLENAFCPSQAWDPATWSNATIVPIFEPNDIPRPYSSAPQ